MLQLLITKNECYIDKLKNKNNEKITKITKQVKLVCGKETNHTVNFQVYTGFEIIIIIKHDK